MTLPTTEELATYYNNRPGKRIGAGVLICNQRGELLLVKPEYLDKWLFPGGGVEEAESPLTAARRECMEEIGFEPAELWPAYIDYRKPHPNGQTDWVQFTFTTHPVDDDFLDKLKLRQGEIDDAKFVPIDQLSEYFSPERARAVTAYFKHRNGRHPVYMENGEPVQ